MFPLGSQGSPEPDIIGTAGADRARPRWRRYVVAGGALVLAGITAATSIASAGRHAAARRPGGVSASPARPAPPVPGAVPSQAWVAALGIANWPMPGSGSDSSMFAGGVAGNSGWELTVREVAGPGQRCAAAVVLSLSGPGAQPSADAYLLPPRQASRTPAGDLAFIALGAQSPGVGVGFVQLGAPEAQARADPGRTGGFVISVPFLTMRACGQRYYLAGFAYPLAGTLDVFVTSNNASTVRYLVPTRLSRPKTPGVWQSTRWASDAGESGPLSRAGNYGIANREPATCDARCMCAFPAGPMSAVHVVVQAGSTAATTEVP